MPIDSREDTRKWPDEFDDHKSFLEYCKDVARFIYKVLTGKDI